MYKYQCSKQECGSSWTLKEGNLNGFVLTCPICGKGRGLFVSQMKEALPHMKEDNCEEIVITVNSGSPKSVEEIDQRIEEFKKNHSLNIISKNIESTGREVVCSIKYKMTN